MWLTDAPLHHQTKQNEKQYYHTENISFYKHPFQCCIKCSILKNNKMNIPTLSITGLAVKSYMTVAFVWMKTNALIHQMKQSSVSINIASKAKAIQPSF